MRLTVSSTLALLIGTGAAFALPNEEIPTSEPAYLAKVKTAAPDEIVAKATIVMMQDGKPKVPANWHKWLYLFDRRRWHPGLRR